MNSLTLRITLRSDVVLTERNASVGGASSLDYIPGSALLGAAAEQLYDGLNDAEAFEIFHSGAVRFCNGVPDLDGFPALPGPLTFHQEKPVKEGTPYLNLSRDPRKTKTQYEHLRSRWVDSGGEVVDAVRTLTRERRTTMRTSIDKHGKAREGLLFGIDSLASGQTFIARIDADDIRHLHKIKAALTGKPIFIGRSRSAEFGEVNIDSDEIAETPLRDIPLIETLAVFLCVSDLALRDKKTGAVRLLPEPADVGLPDEWPLDLSKTFLRTRRYSPFNGHRRRHDLDRQVIAAGSVMVFKRGDGAPEASPRKVAETTRRGIGDYLQDGLGQVYPEPAVLRPNELTFHPPEKPSPPIENKFSDPLATWLSQRADETRKRESALAEITSDARKFADFGIQNAQWGWVRDLAQTAQRRPDGGQYLQQQFEMATQTAPSLRDRQAQEKRSATPKPGGARVQRWAVRVGKGSARDFMMSWMKRQASELGPERIAELAIRVEMLAARVVRQPKVVRAGKEVSRG